MLNGFAGLLGGMRHFFSLSLSDTQGYNGGFEFESGAAYPTEVKYVVMRVFNALFGAMVTPMAYWTGVHLRLSHLGCILLAIMTITGIG
jgi:dolichyl-phosphate-mannose-protein mannosyltransferase